jgi:transposase InsO family protein
MPACWLKSLIAYGVSTCEKAMAICALCHLSAFGHKAQTSKPPAADARDQQARFDAFRRHYIEERPHEALSPRPPAAA